MDTAYGQLWEEGLVARADKSQHWYLVATPVRRQGVPRNGHRTWRPGGNRQRPALPAPAPVATPAPRPLCNFCQSGEWDPTSLLLIIATKTLNFGVTLFCPGAVPGAITSSSLAHPLP